MSEEEPVRHRIVLTPAFEARMRALGEAAATDPQAARILEESQRLVKQLEDGSEKGHHPLTDWTGSQEGDLRDATASRFRPDPSGKFDGRLVWRQHAEQEPGQGPTRELVFVGMRHETPSMYAQTVAALDRDPATRLPENDVFGQHGYVGDKNASTRNAALDSQRTAALARTGVAPLSTSRPLGEADFGSRRSSAATATKDRTLSGGKDGRGT